MIGKQNLRSLLTHRGPRGFVETLREQLGLPGRFEPNGVSRFHESVDGKPVLRDRKLRPEEFSIRELSEAIFGEAAFRDGRFQPAVRLLEDGPSAGVDPTGFLNISAFNATVSGLIEVKLLEGYQQPEFIGDKLFETVPTKLNGQKVIGLGGIGDRAKPRKPGMPHAKAGFHETWINTPETEETALGIDINQETVFFDLTGDVLRMGTTVGEELGYREENRKLDCFLGITPPSSKPDYRYSFEGTTYATYGTTTPYVNELTNPLSDWTSINTSLQGFVGLTDPKTGKPVAVTAKQVVVPPALLMTARRVINATEIRYGDGASSTTATYSTNPAAGILDDPITSVLLYNRMIASASADPDNPGLGLAANVAQGTWFVGDFKRCFKYMQNWPLRVRNAAPTERDMIDRGIIASYFADERGTPSTWNPRYTQKNKPS